MDNMLIGKLSLGLFSFGFIVGIILFTYYMAKNDEDGFKLWHIGASLLFVLFWSLAIAAASEGLSMFTEKDWEDFKSSDFLFKFIVIFTILSYIVGIILFIIYAVNSGNPPQTLY